MPNTKSPIKAAYKSLLLFNVNQPDAIVTFKLASQTLAQHRNRKTLSPYARPLRELLNQRREELLEKIKADASYKALMSPSAASNYHSYSFCASLILSQAEANFDQAYGFLRIHGCVDRFLGYLEYELQVLLSRVDSLPPQPNIAGDMCDAYKIAARIVPLLRAYAFFSTENNLLPDEVAFLAESKKNFADHNLPIAITNSLLHAINDRPIQAGVVNIAVRECLRQFPGEFDLQLASLRNTLRRIEVVPAIEEAQQRAVFLAKI